MYFNYKSNLNWSIQFPVIMTNKHKEHTEVISNQERTEESTFLYMITLYIDTTN